MDIEFEVVSWSIEVTMAAWRLSELGWDRLLAISQRLQILGFIFRSRTPTFVKIAPGPFYQLSQFLMFYYQN